LVRVPRLSVRQAIARSAILTAHLEEHMPEGQRSTLGPRARTCLATALLVLAALFMCFDSASAQLFQWTPEQLIKYTSKNPYDRFPGGRPKVPDEMLARLKGLVAEEVQAVLPNKGFLNQFESRD